jgi:hypothetical protein
LLQDAAVQIKERVEADVRTAHHLQTISSDDNKNMPCVPHPQLNVGSGQYSRQPQTSADEPRPVLKVLLTFRR